MQRVITSNSITFMDTSDERKLELSIESNLPTSQIYNSNTGAYSPDWTTNNLVLEACATLDLIDITQNEDIVITWSKKIDTGEVQSAGTGYQLKISTNELSNTSGIITYICTVTYDGLTSSSQMVFTRVDTGIDATTYEVLCSSYTIVRNSSNTYVPSTLTIEGQKQVGNNSPTKYPCRFKIEETTDMSTWTSKYESSVDEDTITHTPSVGIKAIKCSMYKAGGTSTLLDYQTIPIVSDGDGGSDAYSVTLSNESYIFAELGTATSRTTTISVLAYKGKNKVAATIGTITTTMPTGMTVTISNNGTTSAKFSVKITKDMTKDSGGFNVPITVDGITFNKRFTYALAKKGDNGITFQIYGEKGLVLTEDAPETTLKVFAYDGDTEITSATYKWYYQDNVEVINEEDGSTAITTKWTEIDGATTGSYKVTKGDVFKKTTYKCEMTYNGKTYYATVTVEDKGDIYDGIINIHDIIKTPNGQCYWVLYATVYSENGEIDALVGPIVTDTADVDSSENYCYYVDTSSYTVSLKYRQSSSAAWDDAISSQGQRQKFIYKWDTKNDSVEKVQIISSDDIIRTVNLMCEVSEDSNVIARPVILLTDATDPIISSTEPESPKNGQIWIDNSDPSNIIVKVYDETIGNWVVSSGKNKTYISKPDSYKKGDLWVTQTDKDCTYTDEDGNLQYYPALTILTAINDMVDSFKDSDWAVVLNFNEGLSDIEKRLTRYENAVQVDENGITITAIDADNNAIGPFSSRFTASRLSFLYDSSKDNGTAADEETELEKEQTKLKITTFGIYTPYIEIDEAMQLGDLKFIKETDGSYSITI